MRQHLNTLFITTEDAFLKKDGAAVAIKIDGKVKLRVPLHNLEGIVCFGWNTVASAQLMHACAENNITLSFHNPHGKVLVSSRGPISGNVLLRRTQHRISDDLEKCIPIARNLIAAKLSNSRTVLQRALRDHYSEQSGNLSVAIDYLSHRIKAALHADSLDSLRGIEGESAVTYFAVFNELITLPQEERGPFVFKNRSRRPPLDPINALLSFLYVMLAHDCRSACESVGLDPQMGFLHRLRPGRQSLALDLMEELRAYLADRLCLSLINRKQVSAKDFEIKESGAVLLKDDFRKTILAAWQERKSQEITHPFIQEKITIGLLPQIQARLLARHLRGDLDAFPAFLLK